MTKAAFTIHYQSKLMCVHWCSWITDTGHVFGLHTFRHLGNLITGSHVVYYFGTAFSPGKSYKL